MHTHCGTPPPSHIALASATGTEWSPPTPAILSSVLRCLRPNDMPPLWLTRPCLLLLLTAVACGEQAPTPCAPAQRDTSEGALQALDCRSHIVSIIGPRSQLTAIAALSAGATALVIRDPDYLVLLAADSVRITPLLPPHSTEAQRALGVVMTLDTVASILFYPSGDIAEYSVPGLSRRSIVRSVMRASSVASWRGRYAVSHAAGDSGIMVTTDVLGLHETSSALFADRLVRTPRAVNLFGRALVAASETTLAVIADVADVSVLLDRDLHVIDSLTFPVHRREGAPIDVAATIAGWDSSGPALSRLGVSSPAAVAFGAPGSLRVVFEDLALDTGEWGSLAYVSSSSLRGDADCVDVPIDGPAIPRRRFAFRGDTLFIASLDPHERSRVVVERRVLDSSRCTLSP